MTNPDPAAARTEFEAAAQALREEVMAEHRRVEGMAGDQSESLDNLLAIAAAVAQATTLHHLDHVRSHIAPVLETAQRVHDTATSA